MKHANICINNAFRHQYDLEDWQKTIESARRQVSGSHWNGAVRDYRKAFEIAEQMISQDACIMDGAKRYVRTAIELAYCLRRSNHKSNHENDHEGDLQILVAIVRKCLQQKWLACPVDPLVAPLNNVAFMPRSEIDYWMQVLFSLEAKKGKTLH